MDEKYQQAANYYDFHCKGCRDNCCRSLFFHYTFLEYLYLREGYLALGPEKQDEIKNRAAAVSKNTAPAGEEDKRARPMCPLNFDERCIIYSYRPMICRLHGIAYEFQRPDKIIMTGCGCEPFAQKHENKPYFKFDRTPIYHRMAELEKDFKLKAGIGRKLKMTVAQMLLSF